MELVFFVFTYSFCVFILVINHPAKTSGLAPGSVRKGCIDSAVVSPHLIPYNNDCCNSS